MRKIKKVTILGAMEWDLRTDIFRNFGIDPERTEMLPAIAVQPDLGIDFSGVNPPANLTANLPTNPPVRHSILGFFSAKAQGKQKVTNDAEPARLETIQEETVATTSVNADLIPKPDVIADSALPFARDPEARYALRSRKTGKSDGQAAAAATPNSDSGSNKRRKITKDATPNSSVSSNTRRKTDYQATFDNNPIEGFVVDTKDSPRLRITEPSEMVRINAHRCESKIWNDSKYLSTHDQIQQGSVGECALGWKAVWIAERKYWIVGREDEHGNPADLL
jgi:hypothetical protein